MKIIHEITLDLAQRGVQASVPLTQSDAGMHSLLIRLRNGSKEVKITGNLTATLWVSNDTYEPVKIYMDNGAFPNAFEYDISPYVTREAGELTAELQIFERGVGMFSAPEFVILVRKDITANSNVITASPFQAVVDAKDRAEIAAEDAEESAVKAEQANNEILETAGDINTGLEAILALQEALKDPDFGGIGKDGLSAYEVAVKNGFVGTEQEWLESLKVKPIKGTDYFTEADKRAFINDVLEALPRAEGVDF